MHYQGICHKMRAQVAPLEQNTPPRQVSYQFVLDQFNPNLMAAIGEPIELEWTGRIFCVSCGRKTNKSYAQGHCYLCFKNKAETDICVVKPELCHHHLGTCREEDFAQNVCFQPHVVYLANSSALKVGITRQVNMPTRWLDQGASQAVPIAQTSSRRMSGYIEVLLAQTVADKTNWRALLKGEPTPLDLLAEKTRILEQFYNQLAALPEQYPEDDFKVVDEPVREFVYPVMHYPTKIVSHNLEKEAKLTGRLNGIKGQYLILDQAVINVRKYTGYEMILRV